MDFVRALGRIQPVEELSIDGFYAKPWPAYLRRKMGVRVLAGTGFAGEHVPYMRKDDEEEEARLDLLCYRELDDDHSHREWFGRDEEPIRARGSRKQLFEFLECLRKGAVEKFELYQEGTEDLLP